MARKRTGKIVSAVELATILGVTRNTVKEWVSRKGMPYEKAADHAAGQSWQFDTAAVFEWHREQAIHESLAYSGVGAGGEDEITREEADRRRAVAQAAMAVIDLDERDRVVALLTDTRDVVASEYATVRNGLMNAASKIAPRVAPMTEPTEIQAVVEEVVNEALEALRHDQILDEEVRSPSDQEGA